MGLKLCHYTNDNVTHCSFPLIAAVKNSSVSLFASDAFFHGILAEILRVGLICGQAYL